MASPSAEAAKAMLLGAEGAHVIRSPVADAGLRPDAVLQELSRRGVTRLLVEGGARVAASLVAAALVDEVWLLRGPGAIGVGGIPALHDLPLQAITQSPAFRVRATETLGADILTIYDRS